MFPVWTSATHDAFDGCYNHLVKENIAQYTVQYTYTYIHIYIFPGAVNMVIYTVDKYVEFCYISILSKYEMVL